MKLNFITRYFDLFSGAGGAASTAALGAAGPIGIGLSAAQTALGLVQAISGDQKMRELLDQREAYVTPDEIYDILNATASRASSGYDPTTLNYLTNQADRSFSSSLDAATLLGADPNQLSDLFDQRMQASFKIGAENQLLNMRNFENFLKAESVVADNKAAEQKSQQDILKDKLQAAGLNKQAGLQNIGSGVNAALNVASAYGTAGLYGNQPEPALPNALGLPSTTPATIQGGLPAVGTQVGGRSTPNVYTPEQLMDILRRINLNPNRPR